MLVPGKVRWLKQILCYFDSYNSNNINHSKMSDLNGDAYIYHDKLCDIILVRLVFAPTKTWTFQRAVPRVQQ